MKGDALRSSLALAKRIEGELASWHRHEGRSASFAARELARLALGIATQMQSDVEALIAAHNGGGTTELDDIVAVNLRALTAERWHALLESSTHRSLHPVLSPTVRTELAALGVAGRVLVAGVRDVSYEVWTLRRSNFVGLLPETTLDEFTWPFFIFRVPNEPLDWPLQHVLLYHEIGHALLGSRGGLPVLDVPPEHDPAHASDFHEKLVRARRAETFRSASASWLEEFYSDAVGLCLAGPAYVIAFARLLGTFFPMHGASETHPPLGLRITLLVSALNELGYTHSLPNQAQVIIDGWANMASGGTPGPASPKLAGILGVLIQGVEGMHQRVLELALAHVGNRRYTVDYFAEDWRRGELLAALHIPPIEANPVPTPGASGIPLDPARVFSACWSAFLQRAEHDATAPDRYAQAVLGSLEGVEALRNWESS